MSRPRSTSRFTIVRHTRLFAARLLVVALVAGALFADPVAASVPSNGSAAVVAHQVLAANGITSALVHVRPPAQLEDGVSVARGVGAETGTTYEAINVFVAYGTAEMFREIARSPAIEAIEANRRLHYFTDTSHEATRGQAVLDGEVTLPDGTTIDGSGVGVAIVDSGIDGTHPDLVDRMGGNLKVVCSVTGGVGDEFNQCLGPKTMVPLADTDTTSAGGHGTHVAGIVAGTGAASGGKYHGAAPGATLYGISVGSTVALENALDGLNWVLENHDQVDPPIKVVNNSWGGGYGARYREGATFSALWDLQEALVADGVTVVFAAGNEGGDGGASTTSAMCVNPTPGVICVSGYDDLNTGTRSGTLYTGSSRGKRYPFGSAQDVRPHTETWPDVSAPGSRIISTCRITLPVCDLGMQTDPPNAYAQLTGTSMAAPHVSGIVAQLYQVDPELTPADVENVLEDTAYKYQWGAPYGQFADPTNPDDTSSFEKGHGLVDVLAAVKSLLSLGPPDPDPTPTPSPTGSPAPATTFYLHSSAPVGNVDDVRTQLREASRQDRVTGKSSFSTVAPTKATPSIFVDGPTGTTVSGTGGSHSTPDTDPYWEGQISEPIHSLDVRFWAGAPSANARGEASYKIVAYVGSQKYVLPTITRAVPADAIDDAADTMLIEASFTTMIVGTTEVPLALPAAQPDESFTLVIKGGSSYETGAFVEYDSVDKPSSFTINAG